MSWSGENFLKKALGEDFFEVLSKGEIYKPSSNTTVSAEDIALGLSLVPKTVMSLLIRELVPLQVGENKEFKVPHEKDTIVKCTKHDRDSLSGEIIQENVVIARFMHRSIPAIGLVLLSALELYDVENLTKPSPAIEPSIEDRVQKMIDERLSIHDLVNKVVDRRIHEREAVNKLMLMKLTEAMAEKREEQKATVVVNINEKESKPVDAPKKSLPLKDFLDSRKKKEFSIQLVKGERVDCPDCGKNIFNGNGISACICYGDAGKVYLKKTEDGIKVRFGKNWDEESIEMLLETLRRRRG